MAPTRTMPEGSEESSLIQVILDLLDDKHPDERLGKLAEVVKQLGGEDAADEVVSLGQREKSELRSALMVLKKAVDSQDPVGRELAASKLLAVLGAEQILHSILARYVTESVFLEDSDVERTARLDITAPAHLMNLVKLLKAEIKNRTGKPVPDSQVFIAAVLYSVIHLEDFLRQSFVVSAPVAAEGRGITRHRAGGKP